MITENYVSFETAKLLKEKGFNGVCRTAYETITNVHEVEQCSPSSWGELNQVKRPTLQMAMKWLRGVHKLCISITPQVTDDDGDGGCLWQFAITSHLVPLSISLELYEQYEEACEVAIKYCLEKLI